MILTISGLHGTGKSTIGKKLAEHFELDFYSTGNAFREMAAEHDMTLEEFTEYVEQHPEIDKRLDERVVEMGEQGNILVDSQLSGYLLKDVADFRILLACPIETRVKRMAERDGTNYEEKLEETRMREKSELDRFKELYDIDLSDDRVKNDIFNVIVDTQHLSIDQVFQTIIERIAKS